VIGLVACHPLRAQTPSPELNPQQVVRRMLNAEMTVELEGEQVTLNRNGREFVQKVSRKPPRSLRIEVINGPQKGEVMVRNGGTQWLYLPRLKKVRVQVQQPMNPEEEKAPKRLPPPLARLLRNMTPRSVGEDKVAGRDTHVLELTPIQDNPQLPLRKIQVWVDKEKFVMLKREHYGRDGGILLSAYFRTVDFNPRLTEDTFKFEPPPDAQIVREEWKVAKRLEQLRDKTPFAPVLPGYRPPGFQLDTAAVRVAGQNETPEVWLRYSDGFDRFFSVFQRRLPSNAPVFDRPRPEQGGIVLTRAGYQFFIVGSLPEPELRRIAQSIGPKPFNPRVPAAKGH
jgi:outer membrane lipoprotein-sorting protein